jgi:hypothetical protein
VLNNSLSMSFMSCDRGNKGFWLATHAKPPRTLATKSPSTAFFTYPSQLTTVSLHPREQSSKKHRTPHHHTPYHGPTLWTNRNHARYIQSHPKALRDQSKHVATNQSPVPSMYCERPLPQRLAGRIRGVETSRGRDLPLKLPNHANSTCT